MKFPNATVPQEEIDMNKNTNRHAIHQNHTLGFSSPSIPALAHMAFKLTTTKVRLQYTVYCLNCVVLCMDNRSRSVLTRVFHRTILISITSFRDFNSRVGASPTERVLKTLMFVP